MSNLKYDKYDKHFVPKAAPFGPVLYLIAVMPLQSKELVPKKKNKLVG